MTGLYTSKERVERDGRLVAYAGEVMSIDEAKRRGIYEHESKKRAPRKRAPKNQAETETAEG